MRILHVTEAYGGGVATAIEQYLTFPGASSSLLARPRAEHQIRDVTEDPLRMYVGGRWDLLRQWLRARSWDFDVIHAHSSIAGLVVRSLLPTAAVVYSPHALATSHKRFAVRASAAAAERLLADRENVIAAVSEAEAADLRLLTRGRVQVTVIPHAVDAAGVPTPYRDREAVIVAVGRIGFQKNPESVASLPARLRHARGELLRFVWIGDGEAERRAMLERGGWSVTGWLARDEVARQVGSALALAHVPRYEGMPFAVLEAMAAGTPVVGSDIPPHRELSSVVRSTDDNIALELADLVSDEEVWSRVSNASREEAGRRFSRARQHAALRQTYELAVG